MLPGIQPSLPSLPTLQSLQPQANASSASFKDYMLNAIDQVNAMQVDADQSVEQLLTGGDVNPAEVLTAVQKADLSFRMMLQVRNKLVQALQEIKEIRI